jgi:hypothetical protein
MPVEFGTLPESAVVNNAGTRGPGARFTDEATQLKSRPQTWARIATRKDKASATSLASNIRRGKSAGFKDGRYETAVNDNEVWARYLGIN